MRKQIIIEILIWILILALISGACAFVYYKKYIEHYAYKIEFKDIDGITKGSPVRFMGINVGYVRSLKSKDKHINVEILITKKELKIPEGTVARVEFYGLGGSKSVELMPPDSTCDVGILTTNTIRINDVAHEAIGLVEVIEMIEKFVKNINQKSAIKALNEMKNISDNEIKQAGDELIEIRSKLPEKFKNVKNKQDEVSQKIKNVNKNVEELNKFIKK